MDANYGAFFLITYLVASINIFFILVPFNALHSMYLQPKSVITLCATLKVTNLDSSTLSTGLLSILFPTKILGTVGYSVYNSGYHYYNRYTLLFS